MALRTLHNDLKQALLTNEETRIVNLVKFEKPEPSGEKSTDPLDFVYISDGPFPIEYDGQTYVPNKVLNIGSVKEETKVKASTTSLTLSGTALGTSVIDDLKFIQLSDNSIVVDGTIDFVSAGFKEGDTILLDRLGLAGTDNDNVEFRINRFVYNTTGQVPNSRMKVVAVSDTTITTSNIARSFKLTLTNLEVKALLIPHFGDATKASYINRSVDIYRAHLNPTTGAIIGEPYLLFGGYITKGSVSEDLSKGTKITWTLTNHWGDFIKIQGRMASDHYHRALNAQMQPDVDTLVRAEYSQDLGFEYAEKAINTVATYQGKEKKFKFKKSGFLGLGSGRTIEYHVPVEREVDLRFNLDAKFIPLVYGVRKVDPFPFFADTINEMVSVGGIEQAALVLVGMAVCEGEIGGIYDIHIEDESTICVDDKDSDNRSSGDAGVLCIGNMTRGDVLGGSRTVDFSSAPNRISLCSATASEYREVSATQVTSGPYWTSAASALQQEGSAEGLADGQSIQFDRPTPVIFDFFAGKRNQRASDRLVGYSQNKKFKVQTDYYEGSQTYWSSYHRLLDTVYMVGQFEFSDASSTIPEYSAVVKGKFIKCYNYDDTFSLPFSATANALEFGDFVHFFENDGVTRIGTLCSMLTSKVQYRASKGFVVDSNARTGTQRRLRYKFDQRPSDSSLGTTFKVKNLATNQFISLTAKSEELANEINTVAPLEATITEALYDFKIQSTEYARLYLKDVSSNFEEGFGSFEDPSITGGTQGYQDNIFVSVFNDTTGEEMLSSVSVDFIANLSNEPITPPAGTTKKLIISEITRHKIDAINDAIEAGDNLKIVYMSALKFSTTPPSLLTGDSVFIKTGTTIEEVELAHPLPTISGHQTGNWLRFSRPLFHRPISTTKLQQIEARDSTDFRISINPAMQLLDYLTNKRYGKGLDVSTDIDLDSFKQAALDCDQKSEVTVISAGSGSLVEGESYSLYNNSKLLFKGTIKSINTHTVDGTAFTQVTFDNCVGKIGIKWEPERLLNENDLTWGPRGEVRTVDEQGYYNTWGSDIGNRILSSSDFPTLTTTESGSDIPIYLNANVKFRSAEGNPLVRSFTSTAQGFSSSGYSLYDSDNVKYWRMTGWEDRSQDNVTRHQTNQVIDTSRPLFDNVNTMLSQFNGILRYSNGKYSLVIEKAAPTTLDQIIVDNTTYTPAEIHKDEIIGSIKIQSPSVKDTYNSISANIIDPQNKFNGREITFFNSDYLKQDRGISKSGNIKLSGITNYYNARLNIKQYLDASRAGITISFTTLPKASMLLAGEIIRITHEEFGFSNKPFRIVTLSIKANGLVDINAREHNDDSYILQPLSQGIQTFLGGDASEPANITISPITANTITVASTVQKNILSWTQVSEFNPETYTVQIWSASSNTAADRVLIGSTTGNSYTDAFNNTDSSRQRYYWLRYSVVSKYPKLNGYFQVTSAFSNTGTGDGGILATANALNAANIHYGSDGTGPILNALQPNEAGSDNTSASLNASGSQNTTITLTQSNAGLIFNEGGKLYTHEKLTYDDSTAGFFLGYDTNSKYTFGIGDGTNHLEWDGTNLSVTGTITSDSGNIGGWSLQPGAITAMNSTKQVDLDSMSSILATPQGFVEGLSSTTSAVVLHSQGSIHTKNFFINADGSSSFRGDISSATGVFSGGVGDQSVDSAQLRDGSVNADEIGTETITGYNISPSGTIAVFSKSSGNIIPSSYAALDGADDLYRIYAGNNAPGAAPFRVTKEGKLIADNLQLFDSDNQVYFDSADGGFSDATVTELAKKTASRISTFTEVFTGDADSNDTSTFEQITITDATTDLTTSLSIPVSGIASTASEEYYGTRSNPLEITIDVGTLSGPGTTYSLAGLTSIIKPGGTTLNHIPHVGEIIRLVLQNTKEGMGITSVTGAKNPVTGSDFSLPYSITGPSATTIVLFELDATEEFQFSISSQNTQDISYRVLSSTEAKPDTESLARANTPSSITCSLKRSTVSAENTATSILADLQFNRTYTDASSGQYQVKTLSKDIIDVDTIHSTVAVVSGGSVNSKGYLVRSSDLDSNISTGNYFYHSTLSASGGDSSLHPTKRIFTASVGAGQKGFIVKSDGTATQDIGGVNIDAAVLNVGTSMTVPDNFEIQAGASGTGNLVITGDLEVQGTTTTTSQNNVQIIDKCLLVAANAANAASVDGAGIYVDRSTFATTNPNIAWNTTASAWIVSHTVKGPGFLSNSDGTTNTPAYRFGSRLTNTGLFASASGAGGDRINITTNDSSSNPQVSFFDETGINSHLNVFLGANGAFKNSDGNWTAQVISNDDDFDFKNASGTVSLHIDSGVSKVGIGTSDPTGKLTISQGTFTNIAAPLSSSNGLVIQDDTHTGITITTPTNRTGSVVFNDTSAGKGGMYYNHSSDLLYFKAGGAFKLYIDTTNAAYFTDTSASQGPTYSSGVLDLYQDHYGVLNNVEGSVLSFSTKGKTSTVRQTRAAIMAGPTTDGAGYGFLNILTAKTGNQSTGNATTPTVAVRTTESQGSQFQLGTNSQTTNLVTFNDTKHDTPDEDTIVSIEKSDADVGVQVGLEFVVGIGSGDARIVAERNSADDGQTDLVFITDVAAGGSLEAMRIVGNRTGINNTDPKSSLQVKNIGIDTQNSIVNTSNESVIALFSTTDFRSTKFMIQMEDVGNNNHLIAEMLAVYDPNSNTAEATEYGVVFTGNEKGVIFNVDVSGLSVRLKATCDATSTNRRFTVATMSLAHTA